jgi:hypothetical protein
LKLKAHEKECSAEIKNEADTEVINLTNNGKKVTAKDLTSGIYVVEEWEKNRVYTLTYKIKVLEGTLKRVGGHNGNFENSVIYFNGIEQSPLKTEEGVDTSIAEFEEGIEPGAEEYTVKVVGTYNDELYKYDYNGAHDLWI